MRKRKPFTTRAVIEDIALCTLNVTRERLADALEEGELTLDGRPVCPGAPVTIQEGSVISCKPSKVHVIKPHIKLIKKWLNGEPCCLAKR